MVDELNTVSSKTLLNVSVESVNGSLLDENISVQRSVARHSSSKDLELISMEGH